MATEAFIMLNDNGTVRYKVGSAVSVNAPNYNVPAGKVLVVNSAQHCNVSVTPTAPLILVSSATAATGNVEFQKKIVVVEGCQIQTNSVSSIPVCLTGFLYDA